MLIYCSVYRFQQSSTAGMNREVVFLHIVHKCELHIDFNADDDTDWYNYLVKQQTTF